MSNESDPGHVMSDADWADVVQDAEALQVQEDLGAQDGDD